jgi:hypothetical protein
VLIGGGTTGALVASATAPAAGQQQHFIARVRASAGANDSFKAATVWTLQVCDHYIISNSDTVN